MRIRYLLKIGEWDISAFVAGRFRLDGGAMFGVVPKAMWQRVAPADDDNRIAMVMRPLLATGHDKTVVVDTGCGFGYGDKLTRIYALENNVPLDECLGRYGVDPSDVTDVVATHLHFDHAGGVARPQGNSWSLVFPNANHHIQKAQWEHALNPNPRDRASYFQERIEIIERGGRLRLHEGDWSLGDGFDLLTFHGHTPGQQLPKITGEGRTLFHCGDLIPMRHHFPPPYVMAYDLQPVMSMVEKSLTLKKAADEGWILFFEHDPDTEACTVTETDGRFTMGEVIDL